MISGLNKLTLIDFPKHTSGVVYFSACNFRCPFCHNSGIVFCKEEKIPTKDVLDFFKTRKGLLDGVVLSGGEPTIHAGIFDFARELKDMGFMVKLDTNGNRPDVLESLVKENLVDYVALDVKNSLSKYGKTVGVENFDTKNVEESISFLLEGNVDFEFRTTVVSDFHAVSDFEEIASMLCGDSKYFLQCFQPSETCIKSTLKSPAGTQLAEYLEVCKRKMPNVQLREKR